MKLKRIRVGRRSFIKLMSALGIATATPDRILAQTATPSPAPSPTPAPRITKEMMREAEKLIGIELTDAQEAMALGGVNRNFDAYETVRKIDIPLDTEPAIAFHPTRAKKELYGPRAKFRFGKVELPQFKGVEELAFATVPQLAELIRTRKLSSTDLTKMYLARLKRYGPKLLCVVTLTEDLALKQAAAADAEIKRGKYRGPLHGIPWGAKDLFATKGIKTTSGAEPYRDQIVDYDSTVVERLNEAGAVVVAKLSMGALAQGARWFAGVTRNPWQPDEAQQGSSGSSAGRGPATGAGWTEGGAVLVGELSMGAVAQGARGFAGVTRNPWQPDEAQQGSSGSSAGPGSATAAGLVGFSIGTETLGSIVSPSSRNGVVGLRPTYGRVSRYGAMGLSWTMDKIGPMCRGVEDCAAALHAIYGPDGKDITVGDAPFNWNSDTNISTLRIGYLKTEFEGTGGPGGGPATANPQQQRTAEQRRAVYKTALDDLQKAGAKLVPIELPKFSAGTLGYILSAEAAAAFDDITRDGRVNQLSGQ